MSDYFDTTTSYDGMIRELQDAVAETKSKSKQTMSTTRIILILIAGLLSALFVLLALPFWAYIIVAGVALIVYLIVLLVVSTMSDTELLYDHLFRSAVELYNYGHDDTFAFEFKPKLEKSFNLEMGLFTSWASISSKFRMVSQMESGSTPVIQQCTLTTSDGKNTTTHFNGIYIIFPKRGIPTQQIRQRWKPKLKGVKFIRLEDYEERAFIPVDSTETRIHPVLMQLFHELPNKFDLKHHYVASNEEEVHLALWFRRDPKLPKEITYQTLEEIVEPFHSIMDFTIETMHALEETIL